jgi:hypothetical protein
MIGPNDQIVRDLNTERDELLLKVPSFARKWRALRESNPSLQRERLPS